jgi:excisionase family DNA binding protein
MEKSGVAMSSTLDEVRALPPTTDVPIASQYLGVSKSYGYELCARGEFPCRVIKVGNRYRVVTASLLALLEGAVA